MEDLAMAVFWHFCFDTIVTSDTILLDSRTKYDQQEVKSPKPFLMWLEASCISLNGAGSDTDLMNTACLNKWTALVIS